MKPQDWDETLAALLDDRTGTVVDWTPDQTEELLDLAELDGMIRYASRPRETDSFQKAVDRRIEAETTKTGFVRRVDASLRRRSSARRWMFAAAAAAAAIVVAWFWIGRGPDASRIAVVTGKAELRRAGSSDWSAVTDSEDVFPGDSLRTSSKTARVVYDTGTAVSVKPKTTLSLAPPGLILTQGDVSVITARVDRGFVVRTPHAKAVDLGTRFSVSAGSAQTRLDVTQGRVQVAPAAGGQAVDVKEGYYAVVAGGAPVVKPIARPTGRALVASMPPGSWLDAPDTLMRAVVPDRAAHEHLRGHSGPESVVAAWSGGALDTLRGRLVLWGGGFTSYKGNELYAFDVEKLQWERLTEPSAKPADGLQTNPDGTPNARATYGGLAYLAHVDRLFALGGDLTRSKGGNLPLADITWTFDFGTKQWSNRNPSGKRPPSYIENFCSYDPVGRKLWWIELHPDAPGLYSYDVDANSWTRHNSDVFSRQTSAVDTRRGLLVIVGMGQVFVYDFRKPTPVRETWKTTGGDAFIAKQFVGLDYDPVADRMVGWAGGPVYSLNLETRTWSAHDAANAPEPTGTREYTTGIYGRWRYVPAVDAFVLVTSIDEDVHFFKLAK